MKMIYSIGGLSQELILRTLPSFFANCFFIKEQACFF
jgi:hypothetical protein